MRKILYFTLLAVVCLGCEPHIKYFNANPTSLPGFGKTTLNWRISVGNGEISANPPAINPTLNPAQQVNQDGSMDVTICQTTTFKLALPYGGESTVTVNVAQPCTCIQQLLTFTNGLCPGNGQGPTYPNKATAQFAVVGGGNLKDFFIDAPFPVQVQHAGQSIGVNNLGHPLVMPLPPMPAAGDYTIIAPGAAGGQYCTSIGAGGPSMGGSVPAPDVHLTVFPQCQ